MFHVRIRCGRSFTKSLTDPSVASALLESVAFYQARARWFVDLFLLMPDHLHALISFPETEGMSAAIGDWKRYHERTLGLVWQEGYFDHRLRNDDEFGFKAAYIRQNPVVKGLCAHPHDWPWQIPKVDGDLRAPS